MAYLWNRKLIQAKTQAAAGTYDVPVAGTNDILTVGDISYTPFDGTKVTRNRNRNTFGNEIEFNAGVIENIGYAVELASSGAAGTAPAFGVLLKACGLAENVTADTSVDYTFADSSFGLMSSKYVLDGIYHSTKDCRGNVEFVLNVEAIPVMNFQFMGLPQTRAAASMPSGIDVTGFIQPTIITNDNTPTVSVHGYAAKLAQFTLNLNNNIIHNHLVGERTIELVDRAPAGTLTIQEPPIGTKDFYAIVAAHTLSAIQIVHESTGGKIVQIDAEEVQLTNPRIVDLNGMTGLQMDFRICEPDAADEFKITFS